MNTDTYRDRPHKDNSAALLCVNAQHYSLSKNLEESSAQLLRGGDLKSRQDSVRISESFCLSFKKRK